MPQNGAQKQLVIKYKKISDLKPYDRNPRTHDPQQIQQLADSMGEFGFTNPVLLDGSNGVLAGHGRIEAAELRNMKIVPTIDLAGLTDTQKRAYVIADNKLALNAGWDDGLLGEEIDALLELEFDMDVLGFSELEIDELLRGDWESDIDMDNVKTDDDKHNGKLVIHFEETHRGTIKSAVEECIEGLGLDGVKVK